MVNRISEVRRKVARRASTTVQEYGDAERLLAVLLERVPDDSLQEFRIIHPSGRVVQRFRRVEELRSTHWQDPELDGFTGMANVYYGVVPRSHLRGRAEDCAPA
ncbi:MAG: hypothetical protein QF477_01245, partial [SAR202 cluster bacterium]|nr:hypothetical protein [SAR202 cluster bacterium]